MNRLGLSALRVHGTALPIVLRSRIMEPIGASDTWEWHGYSTSMVEVDGEQVESVSGGGHWGGGMHICSRDHARFGLLHLAQGSWDGRKLLPSGWIEIATEPSATNHQYGAMWWLNTDGEKGRMYPAVSFTDQPTCCTSFCTVHGLEYDPLSKRKGLSPIVGRLLPRRTPRKGRAGTISGWSQASTSWWWCAGAETSRA